MAGMKQDAISFKVSKDLREVTNLLRNIANQLSASVDRITNDDPLGGFDQPTDLEVVLQGKKGFLSTQEWAVQVYVTDLGNACNIDLVALGDSSFNRFMYGTRNYNIQLSASIKKRDEIASMLS